MQYDKHESNLKNYFLLILWPSANYLEKELLECTKDIVHSKYSLNWGTGINYESALSRFYGETKTNIQSKAKACSEGIPILYIFYEENAPYVVECTSRGHKLVHKRSFQTKSKLRQLDNLSSNIHGTNDATEFLRDFYLIFESKNIELDLKKKTKLKPRKTLLGTNGWASIEELLQAIELVTKYVVLRNFEHFPKILSNDSHPDIDIMVEDFDAALSVIGGSAPDVENGRVNTTTKINGQIYNIDVRSVGDNYYPLKIQKLTLKNRQQHSWGYSPNTEETPFLLLYHALIHKESLSQDYATKLAKIFHLNQDINLQQNLENKLFSWMKYHKINPTQCHDSTVCYNNLNNPNACWQKALISKSHKEALVPMLLSRSTQSGYVYYCSENNTSDSIFVKFGGIGQSANREFEIMKFIVQKFPTDLAKMVQCPIYYANDGKNKFVSFKKITEGKTLKQILNNHSNENLHAIFDRILTFVKMLQKFKIVHRDLTPDNIIVLNDSDILISDWQFAVSKNRKFRENTHAKKHIELLSDLGGNYYKGRYHWDDAYALKIMLEEAKNNLAKSKYNELLARCSQITGRCVYSRKIFHIRFHIHKLKKSLIKRLIKIPT